MNRNRGGFGIALLVAHMANVGFENIPPVTLLSIVGQLLIFIRVITIPNRTHLEDVCISASTVWYEEDWSRMLYSAIYHADEWHLYFNMASLLWKGIKIEQQLGTLRFAALLAMFVPLVNLVLLMLIALSDMLIDDPMTIVNCHVGFSGVLFALKVVLNYQEPDRIYHIFNIFPVSASMVYWVELVLIHIMVPNSSFLGHLAGILVGLFYVHTPLLKSALSLLPPPQNGYTRESRYEETCCFTRSAPRRFYRY